MKALRIHAGPRAREHIAQHGLRPQDIRVIPGAAGGPKGLILGPLDRYIFGDWLAGSAHEVHLVGASIGAWRMATACLNDPVTAFARLEHDYIHQHYELQPGQKRPTAAHVSAVFGQNLQAFYGGRLGEVLSHPRYRLHILTSRGRHLLGREHSVRTPLGYLGAFVTNAIHRKAMGAWLERVVFSTASSRQRDTCAALPFGHQDYRTRQVRLDEANFNPALQASCSIPFVLQSVHDIPGAPPGAYWDGGITDYHLHLDYNAAAPDPEPDAPSLVLYPHFQKAIVPGWLDKSLKWRHHATHFLDKVIVLAPDPTWVKTLPNGKLPDRTDFPRYGNDLARRVKAWNTAVAASRQLADEFQAWLDRPDVAAIETL
jgi:hypothetical protein